MLAKTFDAIVLDIALPDESGFVVAQYLRAHAKLAIVAMTGLRFSEADMARVQADAWLTKPVDAETIGAVLSDLRKRRQANAAAGAASKHWRFDPAEWKLYAPDGRYVTLGLSERLIMEQLLAAPGEVVAREDLIVTLTDSAYDFDPHRLEMLIHRLRRKVHKALGVHLPLRTVRSVGYTMLISAEDAPRS